MRPDNTEACIRIVTQYGGIWMSLPVYDENEGTNTSEDYQVVQEKPSGS